MTPLTLQKPAQSKRPLTKEDLQGDLIQPGHPLFGIVWINPERMSGAPCFSGTRVPIQNLFDYLEGGEPLAEFLDGFPGVTEEQVIAFLQMSKASLLNEFLAK